MNFNNADICIHPLQLTHLPHQQDKCPAAILEMDIADLLTGLSSDAYLNAGWDPTAKHLMKNVVLRIKQLETKDVHVPNRINTKVTNILATNDGVCDVEIAGWGNYAEQLALLKEGEVRDIGRICIL